MQYEIPHIDELCIVNMTHIVLCQQYCDAHRGFNVLLYRIFLEKQHYVSNIFISSVTYHHISTRSTITNIMLCMKI